MMPEINETSTAQAPFDNPECDIILRTADGVDFYIFKLILSLVSDVFKSLFTLPQDITQSDVLSLPIVPVTDTSITLESLLLLCYPATTPTFKTLEDAKAVLEAARKYDMETVIDRAKHMIFVQFLETKPLELYALSCVFGWKQLAQRAAFETLQIDLKNLGRPNSGFTGMGDMSAFDYHKLLIYHHRCGIAAQAVGESLTWLSPPFNEMCMWKCGSGVKVTQSMCKKRKEIYVGGILGKVLITTWFEEYLVSSRKGLYARPCNSTLRQSEPYNRAINKAISCDYCRTMVVGDMETFRTKYFAQVKDVLAKVELKDD